MSPHSGKGPQQANLTLRAEALIVVLLVVIGAAVRLYRLDSQSLWHDETPSIVHLNAQGPRTYTWLIQFEYAEQSPLYYYLQYYWARVAGPVPFRVRLLPVFLGTVSIGLMYLLARFAFGAYAAALAALCLALSPQHIWHAQEVRPYTFMCLLAIVSSHSFLVGLSKTRDQASAKWWWMLNLVANVMLVWTHTLTVFLLFTQGCALLLRRPFRWVVLWGMVHGLLLLPWLFWLWNMPYTNDFFSDVGWGEVLGEIFLDDIVSVHTDLLPAWKTHPAGELPPAVRDLVAIRRPFDIALAAVLLSASLWLLAHTLLAHTLRNALARPTAPETRARAAGKAEQGLYLILLLIVPGLILGILNMVLTAPFKGSMYSMYGTLALYCAVGGAAAWVSGKRSRWLLPLVLVGLFGYQLLVFLPGVTRANWREAAPYIQKNASPRDLVLYLRPFFKDATLTYYMRDAGLALEYPRTSQDACDTAAKYLIENAAHRAESPGECAVWLAFERYPLDFVFRDRDFPSALDDDLRARGLTFTRPEFQGHYNVVVYRIRPSARLDPQAIYRPVASTFMPVDFDEVLHELGFEPTDPEKREALLRAIRREVTYWPPVSNSYYVHFAMAWLAHGDYDLAEAAARRIISRYPSFGLGYFALGATLCAKDQRPEALAAFTRAFDLYRGLGELLEPFVNAVCRSRDYAEARRQAARLRHIGFIYAPNLEALIESLVHEARIVTGNKACAFRRG